MTGSRIEGGVLTAVWRGFTLRFSLTLLASVVILAVGGVGSASAAGPWWQLNVEASPSNLAPGGEGLVSVAASNLGDAPANGASTTVTLTAKLAPGLTVTGVNETLVNEVPVECSTATVVTCTFKGVVNPYERVAIAIKVKVNEPPGTVASLSNEASVEGGGGGRVSASLPVRVSGQPTSFGVSSYELGAFNEDGTPAVQAGAHPFQLTTSLVLNQAAGRTAVALPKDLSFRLPPGLIGNPTAASQCTLSDFFSLLFETNLCAPSSVVGVATVIGNEPKYLPIFTETVPVFNLVPSQGEPARLGFAVIGKVPIVIDTAVRSGKDYSVVATVKDATETAGLLSTQVTLWGVPADPRHNNARGWECVAGNHYEKQIGKPCPATSGLAEQPFLTAPTSCAANPQAEPVLSSTEMDSWTQPGVYLGTEYAWMNGNGQLLGFEGCGQLPFTPTIDVTPEQHSAATPTGLTVDVSVPQQSTLNAKELAEADVRDTTVTLPQGVELSPSAANGLEGCSQAQVGFTGINQASQTDEFNTAPVACPDASKVGTVKIKTPLLSHELQGWVYLASPAPNGRTRTQPIQLAGRALPGR